MMIAIFIPLQNEKIGVLAVFLMVRNLNYYIKVKSCMNLTQKKCLILLQIQKTKLEKKQNQIYSS